MFCHKCGTQISEGAAFCQKCGTKVVYGDTAPPRTDTPVPTGGNGQQQTVSPGGESGQGVRTYAVGQNDAKNGQLPQETSGEKSSSAEHKLSKFKIWWNGCSPAKKALTVIAALVIGAVVLYALVSFLREFGYLLFGIAVIGGFVLTLTTGSEKEKIETRKTIVKLVIGLAVIIVIVLAVVLKPDSVANVFQPGAEVRNAYLTQYSDKVTIEDAFDHFFANEKWSTYKSEGYSYVVFTGTCEYNGEPADARITFKITGEQFVVDGLDINGTKQNDLILALLMAKIYEDY